MNYKQIVIYQKFKWEGGIRLDSRANRIAAYLYSLSAAWHKPTFGWNTRVTEHDNNKKVSWKLGNKSQFMCLFYCVKSVQINVEVVEIWHIWYKDKQKGQKRKYRKYANKTKMSLAVLAARWTFLFLSTIYGLFVLLFRQMDSIEIVFCYNYEAAWSKTLYITGTYTH